MQLFQGFPVCFSRSFWCGFPIFSVRKRGKRASRLGSSPRQGRNDTSRRRLLFRPFLFTGRSFLFYSLTLALSNKDATSSNEGEGETRALSIWASGDSSIAAGETGGEAGLNLLVALSHSRTKPISRLKPRKNNALSAGYLHTPQTSE